MLRLGLVMSGFVNITDGYTIPTFDHFSCNVRHANNLCIDLNLYVIRS